ncbi:hypothetical protein ANCCEY_08322 [Ancylostoma ceylanicum]|uniref:WD domain, G-beta repeat protein n=1 Tax=Ancylostoma ceylanicum TaxID=53326 RepID=A0A0D6LN09_9BILA|nr:hypothetical protein ANCCEY_08322 [Ancylostoma ceylanicum]
MSVPMFERGNDMKLTVHTVNWDNKNESVSWDSINISDTSTDKPVNVLQAAFVLPNARTLPLLVVGTMCGAQIFDIRTQKLLQRQNIDIGLDEHSASIADITTCRYDEITCSGDCSGTIIVWSKNIKGVQLKIATQHPITVMNILRKQVIVGTVRGRVLFYSVSGGELMAEVEYRFSDELPNCAIMGAQFTNGRGSNIAVACFDHNAIYGYRIVKKASTRHQRKGTDDGERRHHSHD